MNTNEIEARKSINRFCTLTFLSKKYIKETTILCRQHLLNVTSQIQESQKHGIISHKMYIETILTLQNCENYLSKIPEKSIRCGLKDLIKF